ncbi:hypothetical protein GPALN_003765 [Globodera pallida]|nr:hypothetical protein GPALN_003765 [Globodera pallida]
MVDKGRKVTDGWSGNEQQLCTNGVSPLTVFGTCPRASRWDNKRRERKIGVEDPESNGNEEEMSEYSLDGSDSEGLWVRMEDEGLLAKVEEGRAKSGCIKTNKSTQFTIAANVDDRLGKR